jgi:competence protein ComGC
MRNDAAFTRIELAVVLGALSFLVLVSLPALATTRADSTRAGCFNNLRQMGRAMQVWADNHTGNLPWLTSTTEGGTRLDSFGNTAVAWAQFISLTNELPGPQFLACPSDRTAKVASHWGNSANGLANTGLRNNAVSYFLSFHGHPGLPRSVITGDRDFSASLPPPIACSRGYVNTAGIYPQSGGPVRWTNALHADAGHLLRAEGSVEYVNSTRLGNILVGTEAQNDNVQVHLIYPR